MMVRLPLRAKYQPMTPEEKIVLDQHVQGIAKILYADADKSQMTNLGKIEAGIRAQLQSHVSPQVLPLIAYLLAHWIDQWAWPPVLNWKATRRLTLETLFPSVV